MLLIEKFLFRNKDYIFGSLTLALTFLPATVALILRRNREAFWQLPLLHIWRNKRYIAKCKKIKWEIAKADRKSKNPKRNEKQKKRSQIIKKALKEQLKDVEAEWQLEKCFQGILESTFQYLLQSAIVTNTYEGAGFGIFALDTVRDPLVIIQLSTSFLSMAVIFHILK